MNRRSFVQFVVAAPVVRVLPWRGIARVIQPIAPLSAYAIRLATVQARRALRERQMGDYMKLQKRLFGKRVR